MNKLSVALLLAASLFFIDISPATAHQRVDGYNVYTHARHVEVLRRHEMPRWLKRNKRFRHWYRHSPLKRYRQIGWHQLFEIYRWERRYFGSRYYIDYDDDHRRDKRRRSRRDD